MTGKWFLVGLAGAWLSIYKRLWYTIKGAFLFQEWPMSLFVCLGVFKSPGPCPAWEWSYSAGSTLKASTIIHVVVLTVQCLLFCIGS